MNRPPGLVPFFDAVCASEEAEVRKPARRFFEVAATMCGADLGADGWMVGDSPQTDIEGGRAAGLRSMWIAGGRRWPTDVRSPDVVVADVAEATAVLSTLAV